MSAEENMALARRFMEARVEGYLHEDKSRRHQPGAATRIEGKYVDTVMSASSMI